MSDKDPYDGEVPDSIAGIADTGSMVANSTDAPSGYGKNAKKATPRKAAQGHQFKITAKRQGMLHDVAEKKYLESMRFIMLVREMGEPKLDKPFLAQQMEDLRSGNKPDGRHSATLIWAIIAGAKTLPYASEVAMDLLAANSPGMEVEPVEPHYEQAA